MEVFRIEDMKGGWFIGNFTPTSHRTEAFEVGHKIHKKGEAWPCHYHKQGTEITFLLRGLMTIQGKMLQSGDVFVIKPYEVADPIFLEECEVIVVKTPSVPGDKFNCESGT